MDAPTWKEWQEQYSRFESQERAAGRLWRDIPSITDWTLQQIATLRSENERLKALCAQAREDFAEVVCSVGEEPPCWKDLLTFATQATQKGSE